MKKVLKIICLSVFALGFVALITCYCVIPEQTKNAIDVLVNYLNTPLGIAGGSTITVGVVLFVLIRYALKLNKDKISSYIENAKKLVSDKESKAKEYYELAIKEKEETKIILNNYDERIESLFTELSKVCDTIPNAKVKALGEEIKETYSKAKDELNEKLDNIDEYIEKVEDKFDYESAYKELVDRLGKLEKDYGEREEAING